MALGDSDKKRTLSRTVGRSWLSLKQAGRKILARNDFNLTFEQLIVLFILDECDGQSLRVMAEHADRERTTMTRMIDGLERRNLVIRITDKQDRRNKLVYLTHQGREMIQQVGEHASQFESMVYKGMSEEKVALAIEVLEQMNRNIAEL